MKLQFAVREYTRPSGYFIYTRKVGVPLHTDYYTALFDAINYEKRTGIKTWIELIID